MDDLSQELRLMELYRRFHEKYSTNTQGFNDWMLEQYAFFKGCGILELGCGTGELWEDQTDIPGGNLTLVLSDVSDIMVQAARKKFGHFSNVEVRTIDICHIPYADDTFDFAIANMMLYGVDDIDSAVGEVYRVLKPGGVFYASTFGENGIIRFIEGILDEFNPDISISWQNRFSLQKGGRILGRFFERVERLDYQDSLAVTKADDLADYILTMIPMTAPSGVDRDALAGFIKGKKDHRGVIEIPKQYGMFAAQK